MGDNNVSALTSLIAPHLQPGERVLGAMTGNPRGQMTAMAGGIAGGIGQSMVGKQAQAGREAGVVIAPHMAVLITDQRLLTTRNKISATGHVTEIKEVLSALPLAEITLLSAKRFGLAGVLSIAAHGGEPVKLECRLGAAKDLVAAFESTRS